MTSPERATPAAKLSIGAAILLAPVLVTFALRGAGGKDTLAAGDPLIRREPGYLGSDACRA